MRRRDFIAALGGAAVWPLVARAQQSVKRIAVLSPAAGRNNIDETFEEALSQLGWVANKSASPFRRPPWSAPTRWSSETARVYCGAWWNHDDRVGLH